MKFREGQYNKVFQLIMDNGAEVVAKIPNPNAGPAHYTTASEVATVDFVIYQICYCWILTGSVTPGVQNGRLESL
jgi:hypothetical protein